jgi:hypothetical protein
MSNITIPIQYLTGYVLANAIRQEKEINCIKIENQEIKLSFQQGKKKLNSAR